MKILTLIFNFFAYVLLLLLVVFFIVFFFPMIFLPAEYRYKNRFFYAGTSTCVRFFLWATGFRFEIEGKEILKQFHQSRPIIFVLNHQSLLDFVVAEIVLKSRPRIYFANDYSKFFLFGQLLKRMYVVVRRLTARSSQQSLKEAVLIAQTYKNDIVIFPEGTRHADGKIHKFYKGFTFLAEDLQVPVIPIFLNGFHKILPKGSLLISLVKKPIQIKIGNPFVFSPSQETREEFLEKVHNWFTLECSKVKL